MNVEGTATTSPVYQQSADQLIGAPVSAYDPDRDLVQQQSSLQFRLSDPQRRTIRVRPNVGEVYWITSGQVHRIGQPDNLRVSNVGRDATITVRVFPERMVDVSPSTSTRYSTAPGLRNEFDPWSEFITELDEKASDAKNVRQAYKVRIDVLRSGAALDGFELNGASERDFWSFIGSTNFLRRAGLALMENGNIRAVWKGEESSHLGLHFLGDRQIQYVIFKRRPGSGRVSRTAGIDTFEGIKKQIRAFDLTSLVNA